MSRRVVVANSVGIDHRGLKIVHSPSRWTNSTRDLNFFTYYPWELAYTSSLLKRDTDATVTMVDGCLERLDHEHYFRRLAALEPEMLVMESSTRTISEDLRLALRLKKELGTALIFCGQHPSVFPEDVLAGRLVPRPGEDLARYAAGVDHVCIGEYETAVRDLVRGAVADRIVGPRPLLDVDDLPWPEDDDVCRIEYAFPAEPSCEYVEIQAYASRGCPVLCSFCVCSNIYYRKPNWRARRAEDVADEIAHLRARYPQMEGIFFDEEVHNGGKRQVLELCAALKRRGLDSLKYNAMCGYWNMDEEMLSAMKDAGYYLLRIGIETGSEKVARAMNLGVKFDLERLRRVLETAKRVGIDMYGTFTFGGPGSDRIEDAKTLELIRSLMAEGLLRRIQMSINTPQPGTPFHDWAAKNGYLVAREWDDYDGGNNVVIEYPHYSASAIRESYAASFHSYDEGMQAYWRPRLETGLDALLGRLPRLGRVLLTRTSRFWHFTAVLERLKRCHPGVHCTVLASRSSAEALRGHAGIDRIVLFADDFFDMFRAGEEIERIVKTERFDAAIALYSDFAGTGYDRVNELIARVLSPYRLALNIAGEAFLVSPVAKRRMRFAP